MLLSKLALYFIGVVTFYFVSRKTSARARWVCVFGLIKDEIIEIEIFSFPICIAIHFAFLNGLTVERVGDIFSYYRSQITWRLLPTTIGLK